MKHFLLFLLLAASPICKADFSDQVQIFVNGKPVHDVTIPEMFEMKSLKVGDTVTFCAAVDWDCLFNASLELRSPRGETIKTLSRIRNNKCGADFSFVVTKELLSTDAYCVLHYGLNTTYDEWNFLHIKP